MVLSVSWMRMYPCKHLWVYLCLLCHFNKCGIPAEGISLYSSFQNFRSLCVRVWQLQAHCLMFFESDLSWRSWLKRMGSTVSIYLCLYTHSLSVPGHGRSSTSPPQYNIPLHRRSLALVNDQVGRASCVSLLTHFGWLVYVVLCRWEATCHFQFRVLVFCNQFKAALRTVFVRREILFLSKEVNRNMKIWKCLERAKSYHSIYVISLKYMLLLFLLMFYNIFLPCLLIGPHFWIQFYLSIISSSIFFPQANHLNHKFCVTNYSCYLLLVI